MFGQSFVEPGVWVRGWVAPADGAVVALGSGEADGSAARTTAVPPTTSKPIASATVAIVRRTPPKAAGWPGAVGTGSAGIGWAGSQAGRVGSGAPGAEAPAL